MFFGIQILLYVQTVGNASPVIEREEHLDNMAADHIPGEGTDSSGIVGIIPVIAHDEILALRDSVPGEGISHAGAVGIIDIGFLIPFPIDIQIACHNFHRISRKPDDALDEIRVAAAWITADDHIKAFRITEECELVAEEPR